MGQYRDYVCRFIGEEDRCLNEHEILSWINGDFQEVVSLVEPIAGLDKEIGHSAERCTGSGLLKAIDCFDRLPMK